MPNNYDFLILGAGIFGLSTAIELIKRKYSVGLLNPDLIPDPLAASTDISKIVRMEYGTDTEYMAMAIESIEGWKDWNDLFNDTLYHNTGYLLTTSGPLDSGQYGYEHSCYQNLLRKGFKPERLNQGQLGTRFPAFNSDFYQDGMYHAIGGFVESGRLLETLATYARQLGVEIHEGQTADKLLSRKGRMEAVKTREGSSFQAGHVIVCAGNSTPYLIPDLKPNMKITGHPVFHVKPSQAELFRPPHFSVFTANISTTGWYGFPLHPEKQVVKIANHSVGLELHPEHDERVVSQEDVLHFRAFLAEALPALAEDPIVYTRLCCYTDTLDGHFWIDHHPEIKGLSVGSGGSGHGLKMGPIIGDMIATMAEGGEHKWSARYRWRDLDKATVQREEARFLRGRTLN